MENRKIYDVVVIGGGPAGMMAAGRAAECIAGHRSVSGKANVLLLEKNAGLGKKLLITGGGRCNLTNAEFNTRVFLSFFKKNNRFLFSAFSRWGVKEALEFFYVRHLETKIEEGKRVFPITDSAKSVWNVLEEYMKQGNVVVCSNSPVVKILRKKNKIEAVVLQNGTHIFARSFVLATGGKSHPETGSTGDGFLWLKSLGHKIVESSSALVPVVIKDAWVKRLQGVSLPDSKIIILQNNVKQVEGKGSILFTHFGLSGPAILNISKDIGELLKNGEVVISLDLVPLLHEQKLDAKIQELIAGQINKQLKNCLDALVPSALVPIVLELSGIQKDTINNEVTREERLQLGKVLKHLQMRVTRLLGQDKAIATSGGVELAEVDFATMRSRLFCNLYFAGDILNIDRPSGGYSLQLCWTTGYIAGNSASGNTLLPLVKQ